MARLAGHGLVALPWVLVPGGTTGHGQTTERIRTTARGAPQAVGEAALAADSITA